MRRHVRHVVLFVLICLLGLLLKTWVLKMDFVLPKPYDVGTTDVPAAFASGHFNIIIFMIYFILVLIPTIFLFIYM